MQTELPLTHISGCSRSSSPELSAVPAEKRSRLYQADDRVPETPKDAPLGSFRYGAEAVQMG